MRILIANDDGINAIGIDLLAKALMPYHQVMVIAPATEQSAKSNAMTFFTGLKMEKINREYEAYQVHGTPGDCIRLGLSIFPDFDLIMTGINNGFNIGNDIYYSGTVAAAMEANLHGIKSIAVSTHYNNFEGIEKVLTKTLLDVIDMVNNINKVVTLNVNFPKDFDNIKGYRITKAGVFSDITLAEIKEDGNYHYTTYNFGYDPNDLDIDYVAQDNGYISITPLSLDRTDYEIFEQLKSD